MTDILDAPLAIAREVAADSTINVSNPNSALPEDRFDVMFEAAGSGEATRQGLLLVRRGGTLVQVGQGAEATLQMSQIVTREITLRGAFRFDTEFDLAVAMIASGSLPLTPLLTIRSTSARQGKHLMSHPTRNVV